MRLFSSKFVLFIILASLFLTSCSKKDEKAIHKIHWDRDMCSLCKMVISQRKYAVQVINPKAHRSYMFDDIGCTVLWFKDEKIEWEKEAIIYIADVNSGKFIDAKKAYYDIGLITPMDYGFSAYKDKNSVKFPKQIMNYEEVRLKILRGETMQNPLIKKGLSR